MTTEKYPTSTNKENLPPDHQYKGGELIQDLDKKWLASVINESALDTEWFEKANELIAKDDKMSTHPEPTLRDALIDTRKNFFEDILGFKNGTSLLKENVYDDIAHLKPTLCPISSILKAIHTLNCNGLDSKKIINNYPSTLGLSEEKIETNINFLIGHGLDSKKIINTLPSTLGYNQENIEAKINFLIGHGLDSKKIINTLPPTLGLSQGNIENRINFLIGHGLDSKKIINTHPHTLSYSQENIENRINFLIGHGLDSKKIINTSPSTLGLSQENIENRINFLIGHGLDGKKIINTLPQTLGYSQENIEAKIKLVKRLIKLSKQNISPQDIINAAPVLLGSSSKKIFAQSRLVLENATSDANTLKNIPSLIIQPIESHILTATNNPPDKSYYQNVTANYKKLKALSKASRLAYTLEQINQPKISQKVGQKAILAFLRYTTNDGAKPIDNSAHKYDNLSTDFFKYFTTG
jgi:predicted naringenin-chalcone synthase